MRRAVFSDRKNRTNISRLSASSKFGAFKPETEREVRRLEVGEDQNLKSLRDLFDRFEFFGKRGRDYPAADYRTACRLIKHRKYSAVQITAFSLALHEMESGKGSAPSKESLILFQEKAGILFSALINSSPDNEFDLVLNNLVHPMNHLDYLNTKKIRISGDAGHRLGTSMQDGTITVEGNAGDHMGLKMKDGAMIVKGNAGSQVGEGMTGGTIEIFGNVTHNSGSLMKGGKIHVHGDTGYNLADFAENASIYVDGNISGMGLRYTTAMIYLKGKLVRKGPFRHDHKIDPDSILD